MTARRDDEAAPGAVNPATQKMSADELQLPEEGGDSRTERVPRAAMRAPRQSSPSVPAVEAEGQRAADTSTPTHDTSEPLALDATRVRQALALDQAVDATLVRSGATPGPRQYIAAGSDEPDPTAVRAVSSDVDPLVGATLGEYRVEGFLGSGGMGLVYRGVQPLIGRAVAIKVLKREFAGDANHVRRFTDEARAVSAARHPGIIDIFGFGHTPAGDPYLVMELLEGEALDEVLRRRGALPVDEVVELLIPCLSALAAAHGVGVIHRDLKPANIFVVKLRDGTSFPKLLDFGLARRGDAGRAVRQTSVGGTPLYIAPEQVRGEPVSAATDLYSLGCVAYELLIGRPPFSEGNLSALIDQHLSLAPVPLRDRRPDVPKALEALVLELLSKSPDDRPPDALAVRRRLEAFQTEAARPAPLAEERPAAAPAPRVVKRPKPSGARAPKRAAPEAPPRPTQVEVVEPTTPPARRRWLAALAAVGVGALVALGVRVAMAPAEEPPPPRGPVVVPGVELPAPTVAADPPPAPEAPVEQPKLAPEEPVPPPRAPPKLPAHTVRQVRRRWQDLNRRLAELPESVRRMAELNLPELRTCMRFPDVCWAELESLEQTYLRK